MARGDSRSSISPVSYSSYKPSFHDTPAFHYILIALVAVSIIVSAFAFVYTAQLKKALVPRTISANDFLEKLTSHPEMKAYVGVAPLNIVQISNNNFANLQTQISGLDVSYIDNFIVQYTDRIVVYDYDKNQIKGAVGLQQPQPQLPADFFTKLNNHPELQGLQNEQPIGGRLDAASLSTLKQQFPDVYKDAKIGDFLLRYSKMLVIYDYNADSIVTAVNLQ